MTRETIGKYIDEIDGKKCGVMRGGEKDQNGILMMPFAHYAPVIRELEHDFYNSDLIDYHYGETASKLLDSLPDNLEKMSAKEVGTCLTYIFRGERFCEGHILSYINNGILVALLRRLQNVL